MHCPRCGQQQISEETKFCSKCGFQLHVVSAVLMHGGSLPQLDILNQQQDKKKWLNKKNGMIFSAFWFFIFTVVFTSFLGVLGAPRGLIGLSALLGVFGAILMLLFSAIFLPSSRKIFPNYYPHPPHQMPQYPQQHPQQMQGQGYQQSALPPQQQQSVPTYTPPPHVAGSWRDTNDFSRPSVTEDTTRLLHKEEE